MTLRTASMALGSALLIGFGPAALSAQDDFFANDGENLDGEAIGIEQMDSMNGMENDFGMTVDDLQGLISLPPTAQLLREADEEPESPSGMFEDEATRRSFLGSAPRFVYIPVGPDPMIIPWIRAGIVVAERMNDAQQLFDQARNNRDRDAARRAVRILEETAERFPEEAATSNIDDLRQRIVAFIDSPDTGIEVVGPSRPQAAELPPWISNNTSGIIYDLEDPSESLVLVGDFILRQGQEVDNFPAVRVREIRPEQVIYEYQETQFVIPVQPY